MNRYFIQLSFKGTAFHGWQSQENSQCVQTILEEALTVILRENISVTGAGRTDAGVHASEFFAHFDIDRDFTPFEIEKLVFSLNGYLPQDIAIQSVFKVHQETHARFSALSRSYEYHIIKVKDPFLKEFAYRYPGPLDIDLMNTGAAMIMNVDDFTSFAKLPAETKTNICRVTHARWTENGSSLVFSITADRFLRNMVRAIVGTLIDLGRGYLSLDDLQRIIEAKDRTRAGFSVPACGLYLVKVEYPGTIHSL